MKMETKAILCGIKEHRLVLAQLSLKKRQIIYQLSKVNKAIKREKERIYALVGLPAKIHEANRKV